MPSSSAANPCCEGMEKALHNVFHYCGINHIIVDSTTVLHNMLKLKPNCECCDRDLPPASQLAMICSYECTFCKECVENILENVCPNCGGGFVPRPIRPLTARRENTSLLHQPASAVRVNTSYTREELHSFAASAKNISPHDR